MPLRLARLLRRPGEVVFLNVCNLSIALALILAACSVSAFQSCIVRLDLLSRCCLVTLSDSALAVLRFSSRRQVTLATRVCAGFTVFVLSELVRPSGFGKYIGYTDLSVWMRCLGFNVGSNTNRGALRSASCSTSVRSTP